MVLRRRSAASALAVAFGPGPFLDQSREVALSFVRRGASSEVGARFRGSSVPRARLSRELPRDDVLEFVRGTRSHRSETRQGMEVHPGGDLGW